MVEYSDVVPLGWCCFSQACSAIADLSVSPRLVVAWCSLRRVSRLLLVSPMYASPQLQDILGLAAACVGSHWFSGPYSGGVLLSGFSPLLLWFWLGGTGKRPSLFSHVLDDVRSTALIDKGWHSLVLLGEHWVHLYTMLDKVWYSDYFCDISFGTLAIFM